MIRDYNNKYLYQHESDCQLVSLLNWIIDNKPEVVIDDNLYKYLKTISGGNYGACISIYKAYEYFNLQHYTIDLNKEQYKEFIKNNNSFITTCCNITHYYHSCYVKDVVDNNLIMINSGFKNDICNVDELFNSIFNNGEYNYLTVTVLEKMKNKDVLNEEIPNSIDGIATEIDLTELEKILKDLPPIELEIQSRIIQCGEPKISNSWTSIETIDVLDDNGELLYFLDMRTGEKYDKHYFDDWESPEIEIDKDNPKMQIRLKNDYIEKS